MPTDRGFYCPLCVRLCYPVRCDSCLTDKGNRRGTDRKNAKKCLSGDGSRLSGGECRRRSRKERIRTEQARKTKKERSTNVRVTDVKRTKRICTV